MAGSGRFVGLIVSNVRRKEYQETHVQVQHVKVGTGCLIYQSGLNCLSNKAIPSVQKYKNLGLD